MFPPDPIAADKAPGIPDDENEHPDHHNDLAEAINDTVAELTSGTIGTTLANLGTASTANIGDFDAAGSAAAAAAASDPAGTATAAVAAHAGAADPHTGYLTEAAAASQYVAAARGARGLLTGAPVVAGNTHLVGENSSTSAAGYTQRLTYKIAESCRDVRLVWTGWTHRTTGATAAANVWPFRVSREHSDGSLQLLSFGRQRLAECEPWGVLVSNPFGSFEAGDEVTIRVFINATTGNTYKWPTGGYGGTTAPGLTAAGDGYELADKSDSGTVSSGSANSLWGPMLVGDPIDASAVSIFVIGDSITRGEGDTNYNFCWLTRAVNNAHGVVRVAASGGAAKDIWDDRYWPEVAQSCTHAIVYLGHNDVAIRTVVQMQADLTAMAQTLVDRGLSVWTATLCPRTTSSDDWATTANQTPASGHESGGKRTQLNDWIRTTPSPFAGYFELADTVESARNSGLWVVDGTADYATADGTHPTAAGHQLMAAAVDLSGFTV